MVNGRQAFRKIIPTFNSLVDRALMMKVAVVYLSQLLLVQGCKVYNQGMLYLHRVLMTQVQHPSHVTLGVVKIVVGEVKHV